jgi:hypothetical protein
MPATQSGRSDGTQAPRGGAEWETNRSRRSYSAAGQRNEASNQRDASRSGAVAPHSVVRRCAQAVAVVGNSRFAGRQRTDSPRRRLRARASVRHERLRSCTRPRRCSRAVVGALTAEGRAARAESADWRTSQSNGRWVSPTRCSGTQTGKERCNARDGGCFSPHGAPHLRLCCPTFELTCVRRLA